MKRLLFLCIIIFTLSACKKEEVKKSNAGCNTLATVRDLRGLDGCGFVFELADGKRLEPQILYYCGTPPLPKEATENPLTGFDFVEGKKVKIGYEILESQASICMVGDVVKITCLEEIQVASKD
jgi:hypothetical protein